MISPAYADEAFNLKKLSQAHKVFSNFGVFTRAILHC